MKIIVEYTVYNSDGTHRFTEFCSTESIFSIVEKHEKKGRIINYVFKLKNETNKNR